MNSANYLLLDAARTGKAIYQAKELNNNYSCLYNGRSRVDLADLAPYLFTLQEDTDFEKWYAESEWGNASGLLIKTVVSFDMLYKHVRKFLWVKTEEGKDLYFRFYDPRVLPLFLETCDGHQLKEFFGPVENFICEDKDELFARIFSLNGSTLKHQRLCRKEVFSDKAT